MSSIRPDGVKTNGPARKDLKFLGIAMLAGKRGQFFSVHLYPLKVIVCTE
jgi:hypothetical protein